MSISIDLLMLKLRVLADLLDIVGLIGLAVFLVAIILLVVQMARFESPIPPLIGVGLSLVLMAAGLACTPVSKEGAGLAMAAWLCDALDIEPKKTREFWKENREVLELVSGLFEGWEGIPEGDADADAVPEEDPDQSKAGDRSEDAPEDETAQPKGGTAPTAAPVDTAVDRHPYEAELNGWRIRMILPEEWMDKEKCVIKNDGTELSFWYKDNTNGELGELLSLLIVEDTLPPDWTDREEYLEYWFLRDLWGTIEGDGATVIALGPTDGAFLEVPQNEYGRMYSSNSEIVDSVEIERIGTG